MPEKNLNIVTLNVPCPPDYGGIIDTFFRIKYLYDLGVKIHLHCFTYGRPPARELESLCESVNYYKRKMGYLRQFSLLPFIVNSRRSDSLFKNLNNNDFPILFDGLHTTYLLQDYSLAGRKKFVRLHNIEHDYYISRARHELNPFRKLYFTFESFRLRRFEKILSSADALFPVTVSDHSYFNSKYSRSVCIPPFHPFESVGIRPGSGSYMLYHGDLSINENEEIALILIRDVFSKISHDCILAGRKPSGRLRKLVSKHKNIRLVADPDNPEMLDLVTHAHINIIPAAEPDGFKLKFLFALMAGRHCIVNRAMVKGPGLSETLSIANNASEMIETAERLMKQPFTETMIESRKRIFGSVYDNSSNAKLLISVIFPY
ncbi:MAG: glycosyltransferase family 1 protein [Bacteroidales bacterium]|jgi:hypothetical protein